MTKNGADIGRQWADGEIDGFGFDINSLTFLVDLANAFSMTSVFSSPMDGMATESIFSPFTLTQINGSFLTPHKSQFFLNWSQFTKAQEQCDLCQIDQRYE